jgi:hypothetical protein
MLKKSLAILAVSAVSLAFLYGIAIISFKNSALDAFHAIYEEKEKIRGAAGELKTGDIVDSLRTADQQIKNTALKAEAYGLAELSSLLGKIAPALSQIPEIMKNASLLSDHALSIAKEVDYLKNNGVQSIIAGKGDDLAITLERIKRHLSEVERINLDFSSQLSSLKNISPDGASFINTLEKNYLPINLNLYRAKTFLDSFIAILKNQEDRHILLMFQNESEIRPAGGFIVSYGILTLNSGNLKNIAVDDIYNADRQMGLKLIPPRQLQGITKDWGARDANWFFDFPTSAKKVISLLEESDLYKNNNTKFIGAIAINTEVLKTLIDVVGPIELPAYNITLNSENFLKEIQYEVEAGRDKQPGQNPKRILSALTPIIFERLNQLTEEKREELIERFRDHFSEKDIMIFFKDWKLQNFLEGIEVAGDVFPLGDEFSGDYLAVVNANIAGGKTDAFTDQKIFLQSEILSNGRISNNLSISRSHSGQNESDWWYRMANKNYTRVLTPKNSRLISIAGNNDIKTGNDFSYLENNYDSDVDLQSLEKTAFFLEQLGAWVGQESGKSYFGTWFNTPAGETRELKIGYESGTVIRINEGAHYEFIFEKQSGVNGLLKYSVTAPPGYKWKESDSKIFNYETNAIKAREVVNLTLIKI